MLWILFLTAPCVLSNMGDSAVLPPRVAYGEIVVKNGFLHSVPSGGSGEHKRVRSTSCPPEVTFCEDAPSEAAPSSCGEWAPRIDPRATTVMVRNIPTRFTSVSFLRVLDCSGFAGTYSFFYLPMDFRTGKNMGYCFINFLRPELAGMFANIFHGTRLGVTTSTKVVHVSTSRRQGLRENVALFRGSDLLSSFSLPFFKPFVLAGNELLPLSEYLFDLIMSSYDSR